MTSRTFPSSLASADSTSPRSGPDSAQSQCAKLTPFARKSSRQGSGLLHTPTTGDSHPTYEKRYPGGKVRPSPIPNLAAEIEEGVAYIDRRSSPTSSHSTAPDSEEQLCLPGASPASLSVRPGSDEARRMTVRSGLKCLELSTRRGPLGSLEKMLAASSAWNSTKCLLTWKWKATPQGRSILELSASTPRTAGCESGLLPTARAEMAHGSCKSRVDNPELARKECRIEDVIGAMLKTPSAVETEGGVMEIRPGCDGHYKLRDQIAMLPTPQNRDYRSPDLPESGNYQRKVERGFTIDLNSRVALLPTPQAFYAKSEDGWEMGSEWDRNKKEHTLPKAVGTSRGLKLQPAFVEWMMGYPLGFTHVESPDSKRSGIVSVPKSPSKSSGESQG